MYDVTSHPKTRRFFQAYVNQTGLPRSARSARRADVAHLRCLLLGFGGVEMLSVPRWHLHVRPRRSARRLVRIFERARQGWPWGRGRTAERGRVPVALDGCPEHYLRLHHHPFFKTGPSCSPHITHVHLLVWTRDMSQMQQRMLHPDAAAHGTSNRRTLSSRFFPRVPCSLALLAARAVDAHCNMDAAVGSQSACRPDGPEKGSMPRPHSSVVCACFTAAGTATAAPALLARIVPLCSCLAAGHTSCPAWVPASHASSGLHAGKAHWCVRSCSTPLPSLQDVCRRCGFIQPDAGRAQQVETSRRVRPHGP